VRRHLLAPVACLSLVAGTACNYSLRGGSFPEHIHTIAVLPFENETTRLELTQELFDAMTRELPRALGVQSAAPEVADALIEGRIVSYQLTTPNYRAGADGDRAEVLQRQVSISVSVEIIDRVENVILFEGSSLRGDGQYLEQSESEEEGKREALEIVVQSIVDGAQSNW
jgi:hypothetical protein